VSKRCIAYIDGHNFYHGAIKGNGELKWPDLRAMCEQMVKRSNLVAVKYYTARVVDLPDDPGQSQRQDIYMQALAASGVEIIEGKFQRRDKNVMIRATGKIEKARVYEEKGTDVNLAVDLVADALGGAIDRALVICNDSDLQRAVDRAMQSGVDVFVANPYRHRGGHGQARSRTRNNRPSLIGTERINLTRSTLLNAQFPDEVGTPKGPVRRPPSWS
jgi:uncharacterized LabA/DUF88 family protein